MKALRFFSLTTIIALLASCGKDTGSEDSGNGITGWYVETPTPAEYYSNRLSVLNSEINNNDGWEYQWLTESQCFAEDGSFSTYFGAAFSTGDVTIRQNIDLGSPYFNFIHIIDGNTLASYEYAWMFKDGSSGARGRDKLYTFNFGKVGPLSFGNISFYGSATYYVYTKNGNKLTVTIGDEKYDIIVSDGALLPNGGSRMVKYDPKKVY